MIQNKQFIFADMKKMVFATGLIIAILAAGILFALNEADKADQQERKSLLLQARMLAQAINIEKLLSLKEDKSDTNSPIYQRLKEQFTTVQQNLPDCRKLYILGSTTNDILFTYLDGTSISSPATTNFNQDKILRSHQQVFTSRNPQTEGPYKDSQGQWITCLVPLLDPQTILYGLATADQAHAMVQEASAYYQKNGREAFLKEANNPNGQFHKGDLYVFVCDQNMIWVAHPTYPRLIGQNAMDSKEWPNGAAPGHDIQKAAKKGSGWVEYDFFNPLTKRRDHKRTYVQNVDGLVICSGFYKGQGAIVAALGMEMNAKNWQWLKFKAAFPALLASVILALLVPLGLHSKINLGRNRFPVRTPPMVAAIVGTILTLLFARMIQDQEIYERRDAFEELATSRTLAMADTLKSASSVGVESLARFFEDSEVVTPEEYTHFTAFLTNSPFIQAWEWIAAVPSTEKSSFESAMRSNGFKHFEIWEKDASDKRIPCTIRDCYYPVTYIAPFESNERALGFDLGSEPVRKAALLQAAKTRLPTATEPITLIQETGTQKGMLIYRPVFTKKNPETLQGFTLAVLRMGTLLRRSLADGSINLELSLLHADGTREKLATTVDSTPESTKGLTSVRPILSVGKTFLLTATPGVDFFRTHPHRDSLLVLLEGLGLTAAICVVINLLLRRHQRLETLVAERTAKLRESEQGYRDQFACNSAIMLLIDSHTHDVLDANASAVSFYGYSREQLRNMNIQQISLRPPENITQLFSQVRRQKGLKYFSQHRTSDNSIRDVEVSVSLIQVGLCEILHAIIFDITERKKAEEDRDAMTRQLEGVNLLQQSLLHSVPLDQKLNTITSEIVKYFHADFCHIWILKQGDKCESACPHANMAETQDFCIENKICLHLIASSERQTHLNDKHNRVPLGTYKIGKIAKGQEHKLLIQNLAESDVVPDHEWVRSLELVSFAGYQLRVPGSDPIGVLALFSQNQILPSEDVMLDGLSSAIALSIQQSNTQEALQKTLEELELRVAQRTAQLTRANESMSVEIEERRKAEISRQKAQQERDAAEAELRQAHKLEAIGHLAAGIAHEINTPTQYVGDNIRFFQQSFQTIRDTCILYEQMLQSIKSNNHTKESVQNLEETLTRNDLDFLFQEIPQAISESLDGVERITKIVQAMKDFSHPGGKEKDQADLNKAIETTATVARNEWKYVAELKLDLDPTIPPLRCFIGEINQVVLNLIVNAADAIGDVIKNKENQKGLITVSTHNLGEQVEIRVSDTGTGIAPEIRSKIFDPFFTTKPVGKGTGQGLSIVYGTIVKRHGGSVTFDTEVGKGTTFIIRLPH